MSIRAKMTNKERDEYTKAEKQKNILTNRQMTNIQKEKRADRKRKKFFNMTQNQFVNINMTENMRLKSENKKSKS